MGWLFGKKKKSSKISSIPSISHEQSLSFNEDSMHDRVIHPDHIKAAAGVHDDPFAMESAFASPSVPPSPKRMPEAKSSMQEPSAFPAFPPMQNEAPLPSMRTKKPMAPLLAAKPMTPMQPTVRTKGDDLYIKVKDYKRVLGELKDLSSELNHLTQLSKDLEHSEYNEEKNFLRMKDAIKKVHDKLLVTDRTLFAHN